MANLGNFFSGFESAFGGGGGGQNPLLQALSLAFRIRQQQDQREELRAYREGLSQSRKDNLLLGLMRADPTAQKTLLPLLKQQGVVPQEFEIAEATPEEEDVRFVPSAEKGVTEIFTKKGKFVREEVTPSATQARLAEHDKQIAEQAEKESREAFKQTLPKEVQLSLRAHEAAGVKPTSEVISRLVGVGEKPQKATHEDYLAMASGYMPTGELAPPETVKRAQKVLEREREEKLGLFEKEQQLRTESKDRQTVLTSTLTLGRMRLNRWQKMEGSLAQYESHLDLLKGFQDVILKELHGDIRLKNLPFSWMYEHLQSGPRGTMSITTRGGERIQISARVGAFLSAYEASRPVLAVVEQGILTGGQAYRPVAAITKGLVGTFPDLVFGDTPETARLKMLRADQVKLAARSVIEHDRKSTIASWRNLAKKTNNKNLAALADSLEAGEIESVMNVVQSQIQTLEREAGGQERIPMKVE